MKDRVAAHPGRYKLTKVSGSTNLYDLERADQPTEAGTPFQKATMLTDETATALGLTQDDPNINDALKKISENLGGHIDTEMSGTSENAVQNKVIKAYVDGLVGNIEAALAAI